MVPNYAEASLRNRIPSRPQKGGLRPKGHKMLPAGWWRSRLSQPSLKNIRALFRRLAHPDVLSVPPER